MNSLSEEAIEQIAEIYIVSNTPSYLYKHFRQRDEIKELADSNTPEELKNCIVQIDNKDNLTLNDVVLGYAATVALTFHNLEEVKGEVENIELNKLEWVGRILNLWSESYVPTLEITLKPTLKIKPVIEGLKTNSSSTENILRTSPKITLENANELSDASSSIIILTNGGN